MRLGRDLSGVLIVLAAGLATVWVAVVGVLFWLFAAQNMAALAMLVLSPLASQADDATVSEAT